MVIEIPVLEGKSFIMDWDCCAIESITTSGISLYGTESTVDLVPSLSVFSYFQILVHAHLLTLCVSYMALDLLLSYWTHYMHDNHLPVNSSWCSVKICLGSSSFYPFFLECGITWLSCSSPSQWSWRNMDFRWWNKNTYVVVVLCGDS